MAETVNLYPSKIAWLPLANEDWQIARDASDSEQVLVNTPSSRVGIIEGYTFFRTYLSFDISKVKFPEGSTINSITLSLKRVDSVKSSYTPYIAYAGKNTLPETTSDYSLYLNNITRDKELSLISLPDIESIYESDPFDLKTYPVGAKSILTIGIIDEYDFTNLNKSFSDVYEIDTDPASPDRPYLTIAYSTGGGGYPNTIMGVTVTSVMGIPAGNIANIMGV
jgi:hypothetical protein